MQSLREFYSCMYMETQKYRSEYTIVVLFFVLNISHFFSSIAGQYATSTAGPSIPDVFDFLNNSYYDILRPYAYFIHTQWSFLLTMPVFIFLYLKYKKCLIHILLITVLITILRSIFLPITHLGIPYGQLPLNSLYTFGGDLFFSGHIAKSYALYLVVKNLPVISKLVLIGHFIVLFGVLVGRYHYAIDIVSAYFIAFTLYTLTKPFVDKYFGEDLVLSRAI